ncbi:MAG: reductive dehalogenase domain-containing protein [Rhodospirillales bacterium]|jgi:Pyruvate/2-oxoacid:ferredoxin oxidoreductase delta subunit|nr:reductive dehalogenase domain-containing protein [Rhodospirillales bacterium]MDP6644835.1 reductive dehalogenase domain-containing protein [Rhodospirillales bacterium]MDP6843118.1 reductive dehalogenase domain-containing protein [Rhodospirillales bacterium]
MGLQDLSAAKRPSRRLSDGMRSPMGQVFARRFPPAAKRHNFMRLNLEKIREAEVNPNKTEIDNPAELTQTLKDLTLQMGANVVGVAEFNSNLTFADKEQLDHKYVIVFGISMAYDVMADISPASQDEVHLVYYSMDDIGLRLANQIGAYGYSARMQPNGGDFPLPAYGQLSGIGELGKHGSLISPELGSSFRLCAVSTDMPLVADGPRDHGIDEICTNCKVCQRFCPGEAIRPQKQVKNGILRWHIDTPACQPYFYQLYGCKLCLMVCPFNGRGHMKERFKPMAKTIRDAKDAAGMLRIIQDRNHLDFEEFADVLPEGVPSVKEKYGL